jgi:hypothetical protein
MKRYLAFAVCAICAVAMWRSGSAATEPIPKIEQSIYKPAPPFATLKAVIYVRERERPLLPLIEDASTSLVQFLLDIFAYDNDISADIPYVLPEAHNRLRLPPLATLPGRKANVRNRYVDSALYCWRSDNPDQLRFLIDWADLTTKARYTDSYVFVRRGTAWYFEKHDTIPPWHWTQTQRYFQPMCPGESS